jgi:hypothetical protein
LIVDFDRSYPACPVHLLEVANASSRPIEEWRTDIAAKIAATMDAD